MDPLGGLTLVGSASSFLGSALHPLRCRGCAEGCSSVHAVYVEFDGGVGTGRCAERRQHDRSGDAALLDFFTTLRNAPVFGGQLASLHGWRQPASGGGDPSGSLRPRCAAELAAAGVD
jgi:hypothetical protein